MASVSTISRVIRAASETNSLQVSGDNPVFSDATHCYAYAYTTGAEFYRYSIDSIGVTQIDGTTLNGFGGFGGKLAIDGGLVFGSAGGIINPTTTPPSQVAVLPLGNGPFSTNLVGGGVIPYQAESKAFASASMMLALLPTSWSGSIRSTSRSTANPTTRKFSFGAEQNTFRPGRFSLSGAQHSNLADASDLPDPRAICTSCRGNNQRDANSHQRKSKHHRRRQRQSIPYG